MPRWRIDLIRKRAEHVGTIEAETEREAIEKTITVFRIEPALRFKLVAQKISAPKHEKQ
jgi:hypothetical protein